MRSVGKLGAILGVAVVAVVVPAAPASAHVSVAPGEATQGARAVRVAFLAPTEGQTASTTGLEIHFPEEVPIVGVAAVPVPGWSVEVTRRDLAEPVEDQHGALIENVVSVITWTAESEAAAIAPGQAGEFPVVFGVLPEADQLVFRALQHYSDGEIVRWIELPETDGHPTHPAPVLRLAPGSGSDDHAAGTSDHAAPATDQAASGPDAALFWLAMAGLVAGLAGLAFGGLAYLRTRAASGPSPGWD